MAEANLLTRDQVLAKLSYSPETGEFRWLSTNNQVQPNALAGYVDKRGYRRIRLYDRAYEAHRLAWLCTHGVWPAAQVDHINGDKSDNRAANLRSVTNLENAQARHAARPSKCGLRGVFFDSRRGKYRAQIRAMNRCHHLGYFDTPEQAHAAHVDARKRLTPPSMR